MIDYPDTLRIVLTTVDTYGSAVYDEEAEVPAAIEMETGFVQSGNRAAVTSDAVAYIDPANDWVLENLSRLEGALVIAELFDRPNRLSWFSIDSVTIARDHQLSNDIDNILLSLSKSVGIEGIS